VVVFPEKKMKKLFSLLVLLQISFAGIGQQTGYEPLYSPYLFSLHGFSGAYLDQTGYNPVFADGIINPAYANPAALAFSDRFQIWAKWTGNSEIRDAWFGFGYRQRKPEIPSGLGVSCPVWGVVVSGGYSRVLNTSIFDENSPYPGTSNPNGNGESYDIYLNQMQEIYSLSLSRKFAFSTIDQTFLAIGLTIKYSKVTVETQFFGTGESGRDNSWAAGFGAVYSGSTSQGSKVKAGLSFEPREVHQGKLDNSQVPYFYFNNVRYGYYKIGFRTHLPHRFHGGVELTSSDGIRNSVQGSVFLGEGSGFIDENQYSLAANTQVPFWGFLLVSGGFLWDSWLPNPDTEDNPAKKTDFKSVFLTTGLSAELVGFSVSLSVADNRFYSGKARKQTLLTAGISYKFGLD